MNSHSPINISEGGRKPGVVGKNEQCGNSAQTELRTSLEVLGKNTAQKLCVPAAPSPACPPCSWPWQHRLNPLCPWNLSSPSSHPALPSRDPCSSSSEWELNCSDSNAESHEEQLPGTPDCSGFQPQAPPCPPASIHHQQSLGLTPVCRQCQLWALPSAELWVLALAACCTYACSWLFPERQISVRGRFERGLRNQTSAVT